MTLREMTRQELDRWYSVELPEAFPPNERKPRALIDGLWARGEYLPLGLFDGDALLGYAMIYMRPHVPAVLLDYLGVTAARRSGGLGGEILAQLGVRFPCVLAEAEAPCPHEPAETAIRLRRLEFYRRNGFWSPSYQCALCGVLLEVLVLGQFPGDEAALMEAHRAYYEGRPDASIPLAQGATPPPSAWMDGIMKKENG